MGGKTSSSKHQYEVKAKSAARAWDDAESSGAAPSHGPRQAAVAPKRSHKVGPEESGNELADNEVEKSFRAEMTSARSPTAGTSGPKRGKKPESQVESQKSGSARPTGRSGSQLAPEGGEADSPTGPKATLPEAWTRRLANTMILHTVQNSMILATYLLDLLTGGYGSRSALHIACWEGSLPAVQAVVNGSKAAIQQWHKRRGDLMPLHIAAICSHAEVTELLLGYDVDPNINTVHQLRSLHIAATSSSEVCEVLLANKADFMACSADKDTPLHFANCFQQIDTVELLLKARADAAAANNFGVVPLHVAVAYAGLERMELKEARAALLLCAHGARLDDRDHHGHTPAAVARMAGARPSLIEFLESDGEECQEKAQSILDMVEEDWEGEEESLTAILSTQTKAQSSGSKTPGRWFGCGFFRLAADMAWHRASQIECVRVASGGSDVKLAQALKKGRKENAHLAQENLRLQKEVEEPRPQLALSKQRSHGNLRHVQGLLDQSRSTLDRMKSARLSVTEAPGAEAFQAVREDMEKEMEELRQRQHVLGRERENWLQEKESLHQQLNETIQKLEAAEATVKRLNEKCQALEAAKPKEISRPSSAIQRQAAELTQKSDELTQKTAALSAKDQALSEKAAELTQKSDELTQKTAALSAKDQALSEKDAELQEKRQAEQQAIEALEAKDAQLDRLTSELQAMQAEKDRCNQQLEEEATRLSEKEAALDSLKKELQRLKEESTRQVAEKEETWKSLSELRAQHKELRDQQGKTSSELSTLQLQLQEREVEVDGQLKEKDLTIQKLEEDSAQLSAQVTELEGVRERAAQAEKMLEPWKKRTEEVQEAFQKEQALRKRYHNQMQDMKGAIRVFARIRPKVQREADQEVAVWRRDAFSLESAAKDKKSPPKDYNFDSVFDEHNSQEDVFADCRGLIASAVDGFNVTVWGAKHRDRHADVMVVGTKGRHRTGHAMAKRGMQWPRGDLDSEPSERLQQLLAPKIYSLAKDTRKTLRYLREISDWPSRLQLQVFHQLQAANVEVNTFHYNALMNSLTKLGQWPLALAQFSSMRQRSLQVDLPSFNTLAMPCDWRCSLWIRHCALHYSFTQNLIGAVASISNCAEIGLWQRSLEIFQTLVKRSLEMDEKPQSALINACEKASNWLGAFGCLEWMPRSTARPNRISFNSLSSASGGRWWRSLWAFSATEEPNRISCNALLSCCEKGAQWCQALGRLDCFGYRAAPDVVSFNCGISACGQAGRWEYSLDLLQQLGGSQDEISSTAAISGCDQKGKWLAVLQILESMSLALSSPNQICLNAAISGFESGSQWQRAIHGLMQLMDSSAADELLANIRWSLVS
ncbi:unnamed protein product, partial [Cladocopium goreaui]